MFIGEYTHTLDPKKRLALPSKFRKELGRKAVVTKGFENCLFVYTSKEWEKVMRNIGKLSLTKAKARAFSRNMLGAAYEAELDSAGRILIPEVLKDYAGLEKTVSVVGVGDRVEIWNDELWGKYKKEIEENADNLAEELEEDGSRVI